MAFFNSEGLKRNADGSFGPERCTKEDLESPDSSFPWSFAHIPKGDIRNSSDQLFRHMEQNEDGTYGPDSLSWGQLWSLMTACNKPTKARTCVEIVVIIVFICAVIISFYNLISF